MNNVRAGTSVSANNIVTTPESTGGSNPTTATWSLVDNLGTLWGEGVAQLVDVPQLVQDSYNYRLTAQLDIPSTILPSDESQRYLLVWKTTFGEQVYQTSEDITVVGAEQQRYGPNNAMEGLGGKAKLTWTVPNEYAEVTANIFNGNTHAAAIDASAITKTVVPGGFVYAAEFDTTEVQPSTEPYLVSWTGKIDANNLDNEQGDLYIVTQTMWSAAKDVEMFLQRSWQTVMGQHDLVFSPGDLMMFLRLGRDLFNTLFLPTKFTMTNAKGPIRSGWIACSQIQACRSEYLAEGMKAFEFTGQATTLSSDRTQYWESLASALEAQFDNTIRPLKTNLSRRGQTEGDGSQDALTLARRAMGAVGVSYSPVANLRGIQGSGAQWYGGWLRRTW